MVQRNGGAAKGAAAAQTEAVDDSQEEGTTGGGLAVGPRDGMKAFNRIKNILDKLDPDVRRAVSAAIVPYGELADKMAAAMNTLQPAGQNGGGSLPGFG